MHLLQAISFVSFISLYECQKAEDSLILAHVLARHGQRTTDMDYIFPSYSINESSFYPYGPGELTLIGKRQMAKVGRALRNRYSAFLGDCYSDGLIEAISSEYRRSMMSLQSILAGLYIPSNECVLKGHLNWQPVPFKYIPYLKDKLLAVHKSCPTLFHVHTKIDNDEQEFYNYLTKYSGFNATASNITYFIYWTLENLEELGYAVPEWSIRVWQQLEEKHSTLFGRDLIDEKLKTLTGPLMVKIQEDSQNKINNTFKPKIVIYSGHDINIIGLLGALQVYRGEIVNYGSYVIIEIHKIDAGYYVKVIYENYNFNEPEVMMLPGCSEFCELEKFVAITKEVYPNGDWCP